MEDCIFCKLGREGDKIQESENFYAIYDISPKVNGHALVIPKKHFENFLEFPKEFGGELIEFTKNLAENLMKENNAEGFNLLVNNSESAGQVIEHLHFHVFPRKQGDSLQVIS